MKFFAVFLTIFVVIFAGFVNQATAEFCPCPRNYEPVCATNKVSYSNRCEFDCARREMRSLNKNIKIARMGRC